jgi:hypothetical protein
VIEVSSSASAILADRLRTGGGVHGGVGLVVQDMGVAVQLGGGGQSWYRSFRV